MATRQLPPSEWTEYFDALSHRLAHNEHPEYAEIRVLGLQEGAQPETSWLPLQGITYDPNNDLLEVLVEGMDHLIQHPEDIYVDEEEGEVLSLEVVRTDGTKEIIEIR